MLATPHYASHAEQQAMLGCAAALDPVRHPRRWALEQARKRTPGKARAELGPALTKLQERRAELAPQVRELAAKMTITEVQRELKISKTMLRTIATEHDITFIKRRLEVEPKELARIKRMARLMTRRKAAKNLGTSEARLGRIAEHYGFEFQAYPGSPKGQRDIPPERLQMYRERLIALRDIGITRTQAARSRKSRKKAKETAERLGIVKREWPVPIGIDAMLKALCTQHDFKDWRELIETAIQRLHESPDQAAAFLGVTRHNFQITEKVARHFHNESLRELRRNPGDENNAPTH